MKNKNLEELAKQAFQYAAEQAGEEGKGSLGVFADKYAELIIRECAEWIKNTDSDPEIGGEDAQALLEHFGVENGS